MKRCTGAVIIALERTYFPSGIEMRGGPRQTQLSELCLSTPWNQIEAAMAYTSHIPLLVIVQTGVKEEGLLEHGYDWYVQRLPLSTSSLTSIEFNGVLSSWKQKVEENSLQNQEAHPPAIDPSQITVGQLLTNLKTSQLWALLGAIVTVLAGAFALGARFFPKQ
ncbi:hypothetical protein [Silvibacterium sp.]|uniref:hypothetical protein n=1 Tax=Silvibacterium sp. TaxID=1964179 RepID=UPI0039E3AD24